MSLKWPITDGQLKSKTNTAKVALSDILAGFNRLYITPHAKMVNILVYSDRSRRAEHE